MHGRPVSAAVVLLGLVVDQIVVIPVFVGRFASTTTASAAGVCHQRGLLASLFYAAGGVGSIAGSLLGGAIAREVGLVAMYRGVVVFMVLGIIIAGSRLPRPGSVAADTP